MCRQLVLAALLAAAATGCSKGQPSPPAGGPATATPSAPAAGIIIDAAARSVSIPATVAAQNTYVELRGAIEYALVSAGGKEYETLFVTDCHPQEIYDALLKIDLTPGQVADPSAPEDEWMPRGLPLTVLVEYTSAGKTVRRPLDEFLLRVSGEEQPDETLVAATAVSPAPKAASEPASKGAKAGKPTSAPASKGAKAGTPASAPASGAAKAVRYPDGTTARLASAPASAPTQRGQALKPLPWTFTGSFLATDPQTGKLSLQAELTQTIISLHPTDNSGLLANSRAESRQNNIYHANLALLPPAHTPVRIIFQRPPAHGPVWRAHVFISGRVQGVGFRSFVDGQAKRVGQLTGFVRNLPDGRVEVLVEGPTRNVADFLEQIKQGPRAAKVSAFEVTDQTPEGDLRAFEVWQ